MFNQKTFLLETLVNVQPEITKINNFIIVLERNYYWQIKASQKTENEIDLKAVIDASL